MKKFLITNNTELTPEQLPQGLFQHQIENFSVITESVIPPEKIDNKIISVDGYLRDLNKEVHEKKEQEKSVIEALSGEWPLPSNITGSFSAILIVVQEKLVNLSTDLIGLYPLYYRIDSNKFFFSNSIILLGAISGAEMDPTGILQRSLGPDFANQGSRTILKNCKRLLPGERRKYDLEGNLISIQFDNSLYSDLSDANQNHNLVKGYWEAYKREVEYCLNNANSVNLALSGGVDSRITLGAISDSKKLTCYTFGSIKNYETKIAARLAKLKAASFQNCYRPELYFPTSEILYKYTWGTEALELCSWLEITESVEKKVKEPLLLGELCEALPGRKIARYSTRKFRQKNFLKYYVKNDDYHLEKSSSEAFEQWKQKKLRNYLIYFHEKNLLRFDFDFDFEVVREELAADLNEVFERIEVHNLPYVELYDELFSWYTYTRMHLSKQLLVVSNKFDAFSPAMSLQMLRKTSNLHPNLRLNYRFINKLFKNTEELRKFRKVPTSQAPFVSQNAPDFLKFASWGLRSKVDQALIRHMMKTKNPKKRYRLLKSINWARVYQNSDLEKILEGYFRDNYLGKAYVQGIKNQALERRDLKQWPFANINIIGAAALNAELHLISTLRKAREV
ncbi:hypothetical protein [Salinimicrobium flavum]|uniref:asparagine synthase (glutamine-hydrolyzing) n=1 Tax=Salinimicrobium flavum TaxID=1737065 RepID=A0ABW5IXW1_9FLAO